MKRVIIFFLFLFLSSSAYSQKRILVSALHHLRNGKQIEWQHFSKLPPELKLVVKFQSEANENEYTLSIRQHDVKELWRIILNDRIIDSLVVDGNDMRTYFQLPSGTMKNGTNELRVEAATTTIDDIEVGEITLDKRPKEKVLSESTLELNIMETPSEIRIPAHITITNLSGTLETIGTKTNALVAVRPGVVYTANGIASIKLPSGRYKIYAGRGFEYGIDSVTIFIKPGESVKKNLQIRKEVQTNGWVSSDTHIHTLSHSGHGDATDQERAISIAGEGIELPIITEHNLISDLSLLAQQIGLSKYFTVVPGDEVTTSVGHFNYFPLKTTGEVPGYKVKNWNALQIILQASANKIIILNHARDMHNGFRPFDPRRHISIAGRDRDNWSLPANAMEVVNSGALLSNRMQLFLDWFGMLNRGIQLSPVGASDSHDVARYLVGQARTYIKTNDEKQGSIEIDEVISNLRKGKVMVSFGLLPLIKVNQQSGPGDLASASSQYKVEVEVLGPSWITAGNVSLYSNGKKIHESTIKNKNAGGIKWTGNWTLNKLKQDVFLVVIAEGEQKSQPFWPIVKPFQPTTTEWTPYAIGCSGVVWIDADGDGKPTAAYEYAKRLVEKYGNDLIALIRQVNKFDEAVAVQTASLLDENGIDLKGVEFKTAMKAANASTIEGVRKTIEAIDLLDKK